MASLLQVLLAGLLLVSNTTSAFQRRAAVDPDTVVFELFTRNNPNIPQVLQLGNSTLLQQSNFNRSLPIKVYAHGWIANPAQAYGTRDEYLQREECNFFAVDWSYQASGDYAFVALNGVPIAGATTGAFVDFLIQQGSAPLNSFHLIGFSMGAHVAGNAGAAVASGKVPRITGLDPASADFPLESLDTRLDTSDAVFVDVVHTDIAFETPTGHVDFYPSGGVAPQPGCSVPDTDCCSHCRVVSLYAESINSAAGFRSLNCPTYFDFQIGRCDGNRVAYMGEPVSPDVRGTFYLDTNAQSPFAKG